MPTSSTLAVFIASSFVLLMIPGPSVLFVVARTLEHGRTAGLISMLGVETGALLHVAGAAPDCRRWSPRTRQRLS